VISADDHVNSFLSSMIAAFFSGMKNGAAKNFIFKLLNIIQMQASIKLTVMEPKIPCHGDNIAAYVEFVATDDTISWDLQFEDPKLLSTRRSSSSSSMSSCSSSCSSYYTRDTLQLKPKFQKVYPDIVWYMVKFPGYFVLNVECKNDDDSKDSAIMQCVTQMLTQMHFQFTAFGLVICPFTWHIVLAKKQTSGIKVCQFSKSFLKKTDTENDEAQAFSVDSFRTLCNWLYRIMEYQKTSSGLDA